MPRIQRLTPLLVFLLALPPRALAGRFLTIDEAYHWIVRVALFGAALGRGDYAGTNLIGHPGVTALWLGTIGTWLEQAFVAAGRIPAQDPDLHRALLRLPVAITTALCVALALPLLRRLLDGPVALLGALLWAGEPFVVAHSQLLHLDALLASFMTLSLLALLVAAQPGDDRSRAVSRWRFALVSALFGGLALLTKSPSVLLLPMAALVLLAAALRNAWVERRRATARDLAGALWPLGAWLLVAGLTWAALWPAAWVDLGGAVRRVVFQAQADGGSPHGWGNYFWGQPVSDPGPLFYPVVLALRLAPWTLIGLLIAAGLVLAQLARGGGGWLRGALLTPGGFALALLGGFALLFALMMSIPPKKFDRYLLPIFPTLDLLAAYGLVWAARQARHLSRLCGAGALPEPSLAPLWLGIAGLLAANLAWYHPYELAYFSPLFGGGPAAARVVPVGWGEGYEQAGAFVAAQPDGADRPVAALYEPALAPFAPAGAAPMDWAYEPGRVGYAVLYIDQIQRGYKPWLVDGLLGKSDPVETVRIHGIDYAYIYQIPPPVAQLRPAGFGDAIRLRGYDLDSSAVRSSGVVTVTLAWAGLATPPADYSLFIHVLDAQGQKVGQADVPPGGPRWPTSRWGAGRYISTAQRVPVPADLAPGTYQVVIGLYDPADFRRLALDAPPEARAHADGADALLLTTFTIW